MKRFIGFLLGFCLLSWFPGLSGKVMGQTVAGDFFEAIRGGKFSGAIRTSYEYSDLKQSPAVSPAHGFTARVRLAYRTADFLGTSGFMQIQHVADLWDDYKIPKGPEANNRQRDIIADPPGSRVYQAYIDFKQLPETVVRFGRQVIIMDDHRLIGTIGWRQQAQSFDAVSLTNKSIPGLELYAGYAYKVLTIFRTQKRLDGFYIFHAKYTGIKGHTLSSFVYLLDSEGDAANDRDLATYGLRAAGKVGMIRYALDYAYQTDWKDRDYDVSAQMFNVYVGCDLNEMYSLGAGIGYLEGQDDADPEDDRAFDTLFSTAHKFNGWADVFLSTNGGKLVNGLMDYYVDFTVKYMGAKIKFVYHYFDSTDDDAVNFDDAYGDEFDVVVVKKLHKNVKGLLKYAHYNERNSSARLARGLVGGHDEDVFWARLMVNF